MSVPSRQCMGEKHLGTDVLGPSNIVGGQMCERIVEQEMTDMSTKSQFPMFGFHDGIPWMRHGSAMIYNEAGL